MVVRSLAIIPDNWEDKSWASSEVIGVWLVLIAMQKKKISPYTYFRIGRAIWNPVDYAHLLCIRSKRSLKVKGTYSKSPSKTIAKSFFEHKIWRKQNKQTNKQLLWHPCKICIYNVSRVLFYPSSMNLWNVVKTQHPNRRLLKIRTQIFSFTKVIFVNISTMLQTSWVELLKLSLADSELLALWQALYWPLTMHYLISLGQQASQRYYYYLRFMVEET